MEHQRFWDKVDKDGPIPLNKPKLGPCWIWIAYIRPDGYGHYRFKGKTQFAYRVAVLLSGRKIPKGYDVDHLCRNPACVRPSHLEVVTCKVHLLRGDTIIAKNVSRTHCPAGHLYILSNLDKHALSLGRRACKICKNLSNRRQYLVGTIS